MWFKQKARMEKLTVGNSKTSETRQDDKQRKRKKGSIKSRQSRQTEVGTNSGIDAEAERIWQNTTEEEEDNDIARNDENRKYNRKFI